MAFVAEIITTLIKAAFIALAAFGGIKLGKKLRDNSDAKKAAAEVAATAAANSRAIWLPPAIASAPKHLITNANVITNTTRGMAAIQRGVCALYLKKKLEKFIYVTN